MKGMPISRRTWLIPIACIFFILVFTIFGERGLLRIYELNQEQKQIDKRIAEIQHENQKIRITIDALRKDPQKIEMIARQELGLVKPNEIIYQFPSDVK